MKDFRAECVKAVGAGLYYKCDHPHCGRTSFIRDFCPECGRARLNKVLTNVIQPVRGKFYCKGCLSESNHRDWCVYCGRGMTATHKPKLKQAYVEGLIKYVDAQTGIPEGMTKAEFGNLVKAAQKRVGAARSRSISFPAKDPIPDRLTVCSQYGYHGGCIVPECWNEGIRHHFVPRRHGGHDRMSNLIMICKQHEDPIHLAGRFARMMEAGKMTRYTLRHLQKLPNFSPAWVDGMVVTTGPEMSKFPY